MTRHALLINSLREGALHLELAALNLRRALEASPQAPLPGLTSSRQFFCSIAGIALSLAQFDLALAAEYVPRDVPVPA